MNKETKEILVEGLVCLEENLKLALRDSTLDDVNALRKLASVIELKSSLKEKSSSE